MKSTVKNFVRTLLLTLLAAALIVLAGCSHLSTAKSIIGEWRSEDGYTVSFTGSTICLVDQNGSELLGSPLEYGMNGNILYIYDGDSEVNVFECRPDGNHLTLVYSEAFLKTCGCSEEDVRIELERAK